MTKLHKVILIQLVLTSGSAAAQAQTVVEAPSERVRSAITPQEVPNYNINRIIELIDDRVNKARTSRGLQTIQYDNDLAGVAVVHSADMAESGFFGHTNLRGENATQRANRLGYLCVSDPQTATVRSLGENLFTGYLFKSYKLIYSGKQIVAEFDWKSEGQIAQEVVEGWLASAPHRKNLLHDGYQLYGIGVVISDAFEIFVTQNLC